MQLQSLAGPCKVANPGGNANAASIAEPSTFAAILPAGPNTAAVSTGVQAVGDGVIDCGENTAESCNGLFLLPYGVGSASTFILKAYGWRRTVANNDARGAVLWVPFLLASFTCTLCTQTGRAGTPVAVTSFFCGTIALGVGNANVSNEIISPTGNVIASIMLDVKGAAFVELRYDMNSSSTSANCLVGKI